MKWTAADLPDLSGRSAIITGANSGIGWRTARDLAEHGARVVMACRDFDRGARAVRRIRAAVPSADVEIAGLDLASLASVRQFAAEWTGVLDLLVDNAGVMAPPAPARTADGYELQFGTNHLGHFALTGLLLPALLAASAPRVVTVSSIAHHGGTAEVLDGNAGTAYEPRRTYANSKLANLLFVTELDRLSRAHDTALVATAAHPGVSATGLFTAPQGMGASRVVRIFGPMVLALLAQSARAGARATLYAATNADAGSYTGPRRLGETRGPIGRARRSLLATDSALARRLWTISEELTDVRYPWPDAE